MSEIEVQRVLPGHRHEKRVPVLYLDLDGTVRWGLDELGRFVNGPEDVRVFDVVPDLLEGYKRAGWRIVGVSNQGGVALGHVSADAVKAAMLETHRQTGEAFDRLMWCCHHPGAEDPEMAVCWCRKPAPGLLIEGALDLAHESFAQWKLLSRKAQLWEPVPPPEIYPPHLALMVGDRPEDEACAVNANVRFMSASEWRAGAHRP